MQSCGELSALEYQKMYAHYVETSENISSARPTHRAETERGKGAHSHVACEANPQTPKLNGTMKIVNKKTTSNGLTTYQHTSLQYGSIERNCHSYLSLTLSSVKNAHLTSHLVLLRMENFNWRGNMCVCVSVKLLVCVGWRGWDTTRGSLRMVGRKKIINFL